MTSKLEQSAGLSKVRSENNEYFDFENFASLIYDLLLHHEETTRVHRRSWSVADLLRQLPLDPDSGFKQIWDILCLFLLLYCSFSVPYSIAFDDNVKGASANGLTPIQIFELFVDCIFMLDIALAFVTACDSQGYVIRDFRVIARTYLLSWFLPDLAGSFPFDKVISAALSEQGSTSSGIASTNLLRALKLVRMLKLIRAVKFMNKLNKLKQQEGFEAYGAAISLGSALFVLIFVAHLLGCFLTIMAQFETASNWLLKYRSRSSPRAGIPPPQREGNPLPPPPRASLRDSAADRLPQEPIGRGPPSARGGPILPPSAHSLPTPSPPLPSFLAVHHTPTRPRIFPSSSPGARNVRRLAPRRSAPGGPRLGQPYSGLARATRTSPSFVHHSPLIPIPPSLPAAP